MLSNIFEIHCYQQHVINNEGEQHLEYWRIKGNLLNLKQLHDEINLKNNYSLPYCLLLPDKDLHLFFIIKCHCHYKENILSFINDNRLQLERKTFLDFTKLNQEESRLLCISVKNWFQDWLIHEFSFHKIGNFLYTNQNEKLITIDNYQRIIITGFYLNCYIHGSHTIRFNVNVKKKHFRKLPTQETLVKINTSLKNTKNLLQQQPIWVYTPFKGIPGRLTSKESNTSNNESNSQQNNNQSNSGRMASVVLEGNVFTFSCDNFLFGVDTKVNDYLLDKYFPSSNLQKSLRNRNKKNLLQTSSNSSSNNTTNNNNTLSNTNGTIKKNEKQNKRSNNGSDGSLLLNGTSPSKKKKKLLEALYCNTNPTSYSDIPSYQYTRFRSVVDNNNIKTSPSTTIINNRTVNNGSNNNINNNRMENIRMNFMNNNNSQDSGLSTILLNNNNNNRNGLSSFQQQQPFQSLNSQQQQESNITSSSLNSNNILTDSIMDLVQNENIIPKQQSSVNQQQLESSSFDIDSLISNTTTSLPLAASTTTTTTHNNNTHHQHGEEANEMDLDDFMSTDLHSLIDNIDWGGSVENNNRENRDINNVNNNDDAFNPLQDVTPSLLPQQSSLNTTTTNNNNSNNVVGRNTPPIINTASTTSELLMTNTVATTPTTQGTITPSTATTPLIEQQPQHNISSLTPSFVPPQTPTSLLQQPPKSIETLTKEFKEELELREQQRKSVKELYRSLTDENFIYEPQTKTSSSYLFPSVLMDSYLDSNQMEKTKSFSNDFLSYYSTPMYFINSNNNNTFEYNNSDTFSRLTNYSPTCTSSSQERVNLLSSGKIKKQEKNLFSTTTAINGITAEDKKKKKKLQMNEGNMLTSSSSNNQLLNLENNFEDEIITYDFLNCSGYHIVDTLTIGNSHLSISDILKKTIEISLECQNENNQSEILEFILNGCWRSVDEEYNTLISNNHKIYDIMYNTLELTQIISRSYHPFQNEEEIITKVTTDDLSATLFKISDIFTKMNEKIGEADAIKGPIKLESVFLHGLNPPSVRIGYMEQWLDAHPEIIQEWEKSLLEPFAEPKKINYLVIGTDSNAFNVKEQFNIGSDLNTFFENLSTIYEACKLGVHIPIHYEGIHDGIIPIKFQMSNVPISNRNQYNLIEEFINQMIQSIKQCEEILLQVTNNLITKDELIVIYFVYPYQLVDKILTIDTFPLLSYLSNIYGNILENLQSICLSMNGIFPTIHFIDQSVVDEIYLQNPLSTLKHISLEIFNKCRKQKRWNNNLSGYFSLLYEPSLVLTPLDTMPQTAENINSRNNRSPYSEVQQQRISLHCGYSIIGQENDEFFVSAVWTDGTGNLLESNVFCSSDFHSEEVRKLELILQKLHEQSTMYISSLSTQHSGIELFSWEYDVCKLSPSENELCIMTEDEFTIWNQIKEQFGTTRGTMSIVTVNDNPSIQFFRDMTTSQSSEQHSSTNPPIESFIHIQEECGYIISSFDEKPSNFNSPLQHFSSDFVYPHRVLEVKLYVKGSEKGFHINTIRTICKQYFNLSWLTVSPLFPYRSSVLPIHLQLLRNINTNILKYIQFLHKKEKSSQFTSE
ncbi:hypothetical protein ABK040_001558 [Willaertia magna]